MNLRWIYFPFGLFAFYLIFGEGLRSGTFTASGEAIVDIWQGLLHVFNSIVHMIRLAVWG